MWSFGEKSQMIWCWVGFLKFATFLKSMIIGQFYLMCCYTAVYRFSKKSQMFSPYNHQPGITGTFRLVDDPGETLHTNCIVGHTVSAFVYQIKHLIL